jgi:hypothetical protein
LADNSPNGKIAGGRVLDADELFYLLSVARKLAPGCIH